MLTHKANRIAVGGHTSQVCRALKRLGMRRCSERLVRYQFCPSPLRLDWYGCFFRFFTALWVAHRPGAEFLYEDFCARVRALRDAEDGAQASGWYEQLATCAREHGEALAAAIAGHDDAAIRRELAESIAAERRLLAMLEAKPAALLKTKVA